MSSVYEIPPLLVTGQRRMEEDSYAHPAREVTVKKLRLLAARAHADALVVIDHGYRVGGANALAALNVLIVPMFFVPFLDNTVDGYAEAFLLDVRNGYLYGQVSEEDKRGAAYSTIYGPKPKAIAGEQWKDLGAALHRNLASLLVAERARVAAVPASPQGHD